MKTPFLLASYLIFDHSLCAEKNLHKFWILRQVLITYNKYGDDVAYWIQVRRSQEGHATEIRHIGHRCLASWTEAFLELDYEVWKATA